MKVFHLFAWTALQLMVTAVPQHGPRDIEGDVFHNGHFYKYLPGAKTYRAAVQVATSMNHCGVQGHLADLTSPQESTALAEFLKFLSLVFRGRSPTVTIGPPVTVWVGLQRDTFESPFHWSDNSTLNYTNWFSGQPRRGKCVYATFNGWSTEPCHRVTDGILVEFDCPSKTKTCLRQAFQSSGCHCSDANDTTCWMKAAKAQCKQQYKNRNYLQPFRRVVQNHMALTCQSAGD